MNIWQWDPQDINIFNEYIYIMREEGKKEIWERMFRKPCYFGDTIVPSKELLEVYKEQRDLMELIDDDFLKEGIIKPNFLEGFLKPLEDMNNVKVRVIGLQDFLKDSTKLLKELQKDLEGMDK